jgi:hypothetical protein
MQASLTDVGRVLGLVTYLSSFGRRWLLETISLLADGLEPRVALYGRINRP